jgi:hypothetical protein
VNIQRSTLAPKANESMQCQQIPFKHAEEIHKRNNMEIHSETLAEDELVAITGYQRPSMQLDWLNRNGWKYVLTGSRRPVVGRVYARMKLSGVKPSSENIAAEAWSLDLSRVG